MPLSLHRFSLSSSSIRIKIDVIKVIICHAPIAMTQKRELLSSTDILLNMESSIKWNTTKTDVFHRFSLFVPRMIDLPMVQKFVPRGTKICTAALVQISRNLYHTIVFALTVRICFCSGKSR